MKTDNQLQEYTQLLHTTVKKAQEALAEWIVPDGIITDKEVLNTLLGILDNGPLVQQMRRTDPDVHQQITEKIWEDSPNVRKTSYDAIDQTLDIEFRNGRIYRYTGVPTEKWIAMTNALSVGSFLATEIKGFYGYVQIN